MKIDFKKVDLKEFLEHKTMYYEKIDLSIISKSWEILKKEINLPFIIHIVGTNGKGSTGRFLAYYLHKMAKKVVHYSSPHIMKFNERIWINGSDVDDETLENAHKFLQNLYEYEYLEKLSYFEYTTLLGFYLSNNCDYLVLEAGLGGEFDATNIAPNDISLISTIDIDHEKFLGNSIKEIASTKMRSVDKKMLVGYQIHKEVETIAYEIQKEKDIEVKIVKDFEKYELNDKFASYLKRNIHLVIQCLEELKIDIDLSIFEDTPLFGRCQKIDDNITIDVGHNPLAARAILQEFENQKVTLIYNSYEDKDFKKVLEILSPIIKDVMIMPLKDKRIVKESILKESIKNLDLNIVDLKIEENNQYLVFGSFLVVEKFLKMIGKNEK